jgi:hypothetical protein
MNIYVLMALTTSEEGTIVRCAAYTQLDDSICVARDQFAAPALALKLMVREKRYATLGANPVVLDPSNGDDVAIRYSITWGGGPGVEYAWVETRLIP